MTPSDEETPPEQAADISEALGVIEEFLLGRAPHLTRVEVAEQAGVSLVVAQQLWRLLGFPNTTDEDVAFTDGDVQALRFTDDLMNLGVISPDSQAALVRTWGRSYARLTEWQTDLLASVAPAEGDPNARLAEFAAVVLPRVESLQTYIWRRHLASAASRLLTTTAPAGTGTAMAVCFVDIVGYTTQSKNLDEGALVSWIEHFEDQATLAVNDHGGRVIKTIGDEILFVADSPTAAAEIALQLTARGADDGDAFPAVRAGIAYGDVVNRLGDVFGPTVNVAARLTSVSRPGTVLVDRGVHDHLCPEHLEHPEDPTAGPDGPGAESAPPIYRFKRMRRTSVKGYSRLESWVLRRRPAVSRLVHRQH